MKQPTVKVKDISNLLEGDMQANVGVNLGNPLVDARVNGLLRAIASQASHAYVLKWEGNKIPRGAVVDGETIAWTQHGCVTSDSGKMVGTYERVVEFGGESGKEQVMFVYTR